MDQDPFRIILALAEYYVSTTLETSGEDFKTTLETSGENCLLRHFKKVDVASHLGYKVINLKEDNFVNCPNCAEDFPFGKNEKLKNEIQNPLCLTCDFPLNHGKRGWKYIYFDKVIFQSQIFRV
jgi:hypothetical protein